VTIQHKIQPPTTGNTICNVKKINVVLIKSHKFITNSEINSHDEMCKMVISSFCHSVNEIFTHMGCYAAPIGSQMPMFWDNLSISSSRVFSSQEDP